MADHAAERDRRTAGPDRSHPGRQPARLHRATPPSASAGRSSSSSSSSWPRSSPGRPCWSRATSAPAMSDKVNRTVQQAFLTAIAMYAVMAPIGYFASPLAARFRQRLARGARAGAAVPAHQLHVQHRHAAVLHADVGAARRRRRAHADAARRDDDDSQRRPQRDPDPRPRSDPGARHRWARRSAP